MKFTVGMQVFQGRTVSFREGNSYKKLQDVDPSQVTEQKTCCEGNIFGHVKRPAFFCCIKKSSKQLW